MQAVFGILSWLDHLSVDHVKVLREVILQFFTFRLHSSRPCYGVLRCLDGLVSLIVRTRTEDRVVEPLEFVEEASLVGEDGNPCLSPRFGGFNYLLGSALVCWVAVNGRTRVRSWSASSKSLSRTDTVFSSADLFMYLPK